MPRTGAGLLLLVAAGCGPSGPHVEFVSPVGFRGELGVVEDAAGGTPPMTEGGRDVLTVPHNGVRKGPSPDGLRQPHTRSARFPNGTVLTHDSRNVFPDDAPRRQVPAGGPRGAAFVGYFVGTRGQARTFLDAPPRPAGAAGWVHHPGGVCRVLPHPQRRGGLAGPALSEPVKSGRPSLGDQGIVSTASAVIRQPASADHKPSPELLRRRYAELPQQYARVNG